MRKLIESTHVALGGEIGSLDWAFPYLDDEHARYATELLDGADALLLGRRTYEGLSAAYPAMAPAVRGPDELDPQVRCLQDFDPSHLERHRDPGRRGRLRR